MVEFALVVPVFLTLVLGLMGGAWLFFMNAAVTDAARSAAREASIKNPLVTVVNGEACATPANTYNPQTIQGAAQQAANIVPVDPNPLCEVSAQTLAQTSAGATAAVQILASPSAQSPTTVTATVIYTAQVPVPIFSPTITLQASSTLNVECPPGSC
jgi:Flp pilus assembly protein TadG